MVEEKHIQQINYLVEFELPDEKWIDTNGDGGFAHAREELWRHVFQEAQCSHLMWAMKWQGNKFGGGKLTQEEKDLGSRIHNTWADIINDAKKEYELI